MTEINAELNDAGIRFRYNSACNKAFIAKRIRDKSGLYDVYDDIELNIEDLRALQCYLDQVLRIMEQRKWEELERGRGDKICHDKE